MSRVLCGERFGHDFFVLSCRRFFRATRVYGSGTVSLATLPFIHTTQPLLRKRLLNERASKEQQLEQLEKELAGKLASSESARTQCATNRRDTEDAQMQLELARRQAEQWEAQYKHAKVLFVFSSLFFAVSSLDDSHTTRTCRTRRRTFIEQRRRQHAQLEPRLKSCKRERSSMWS